MSITASAQQFDISGHHVTMKRTPDGVLEIDALNDNGAAASLGWAHAEDRLVQMVLTRLVGQGRLAECLKADETTLGIERWLNGRYKTLRANEE